MKEHYMSLLAAPNVMIFTYPQYNARWFWTCAYLTAVPVSGRQHFTLLVYLRHINPISSVSVASMTFSTGL